jgi:hypothetical protein
MKNKWQVSRKQYAGKNVLGEKIYKVCFIKTEKAFVLISGKKTKIDVVVDHKEEIVLE